MWCETTIAAHYGEHPFSALARLGGQRSDMNGTPYILKGGKFVPLVRQVKKGMGGLLEVQVPRVQTSNTPQDIADALATAWASVIGGDPPDGAINVLLAQSAFETGHWVSCWNNNLGNVKHFTGDGFSWFSMSATEGDQAVVMVASKWKSFLTLDLGAAFFLKFHSTHFPTAWQSVLAGDVPGFVAALKNAGYFTGNLAQYTAGVQAYSDRYAGIVPQATPGPSALIATGIVGAGLLLGALSQNGGLDALLDPLRDLLGV